MKRGIFTLSLVLMVVTLLAQPKFDNYFTKESLRIDYVFAGNNKETKVFFKEMIKEPYWGGVKKISEELSTSGEFRFNVYHQSTKTLIYSKGYNTLFNEWQTTAEASAMERVFAMSAIFPYPKENVTFVIEKRDFATSEYVKVYEMEVNPTDYLIRPEVRNKCNVTEIMKNGEPDKMVDIVFIAEGYTKSEMPKFISDVRKMTDSLMAQGPYKEHKDKFNIYAIESVSEESGTDIPGEAIYKNTILNSSFSTFRTDRYLTTDEAWKISDIAANAPNDAIIVLVNTEKYGGGGFYNNYAISSVDNVSSSLVTIHEFGHSFVGLADEYYDGDVAYEEFYNLKHEPWEKNITTMVNFDTKWKSMLAKKTPIPTPRNDKKYLEKVGVFEGGGYMAKGIYSPYNECIMSTLKTKVFCSVCKKAISETIKFYTE